MGSHNLKESDADFKARETFMLSDVTSCISLYKNWVECHLNPKINRYSNKIVLKVSRIGQAAAFLAYSLVLIVTNWEPHKPTAIFQLHDCYL